MPGCAWRKVRKTKLALSELVTQVTRKATRGDRLKPVTEAALNAAASSDENEVALVLQDLVQQWEQRDAAAFGDLRQLVLPRLSEKGAKPFEIVRLCALVCRFAPVCVPVLPCAALYSRHSALYYREAT